MTTNEMYKTLKDAMSKVMSVSNELSLAGYGCDYSSADAIQALIEVVCKKQKDEDDAIHASVAGE